MKDLITNGYGSSSSGASLDAIHWDLATLYLNKETKGTVDPFGLGCIRDPYNKKIDKNLHIHSKTGTIHNWSKN